MKYYLAFKGVTHDLKSVWAGGKLCHQYEVGKIHRSHPLLPFYLVNYYARTGIRLRTGIDSGIAKVLLVRVPASSCRFRMPFVSEIQSGNAGLGRGTSVPNTRRKYTEMARKAQANNCDDFGYGTTCLTVLEVCEQFKSFPSVHDAMLFYEKKYGLPRLVDFRSSQNCCS